MSTRLLARIKAVFEDGSTPVISKLHIQPLQFAQYTAGHIIIDGVNTDGSARSLLDIPLILGVRRHPTDAEPTIGVEATYEYGDPDNRARFELVPGHWIGVDPKMYGYSVDAVISADDRFPVVPASPWQTTDNNVHPGDDVEVPVAQQPLTGPPGIFLRTTDIQADDYTAAFNDRVLVDPTDGDFAVTLPLAASRVNGKQDTIQIKNVSDSANAVTVTPSGIDLIDGQASIPVGAREVVTLVAYADGLWGVV